jgi:DNA-binding transcriptional LysR family regulator
VDTTKLSAFVTAAEAGSLSRAAQRLGAQLSTVSRQIADLEESLGASLLVRTGRGVRLTAAGERFLERARHVLRELEVARAEVHDTARPELTELRISAPPDFSARVLPPVLFELARRHPRLAVEARVDTRRVSLLEESYDAVLRLGRLEASELLARRLGVVSLVACAAPGHAIETLSALGDAEHVLVHGARAAMTGTLRGRAVELRCEGRIRVSTFGEAAEVVARGDRVAILPSTSAAPLLATGELVRVVPHLVLPQVELHLLRTSRHRGSQVLEDLGELVSAHLEAAEATVRAVDGRPLRRRARR